MILHICWQDGVGVEGSSFYGFIQKYVGFFFQYWSVLETKHLEDKYTPLLKRLVFTNNNNKDFGLEYSI